jgi:hypothetical protein
MRRPGYHDVCRQSVIHYGDTFLSSGLYKSHLGTRALDVENTDRTVSRVRFKVLVSCLGRDSLWPDDDHPHRSRAGIEPLLV